MKFVHTLSATIVGLLLLAFGLASLTQILWTLPGPWYISWAPVAIGLYFVFPVRTEAFAKYVRGFLPGQSKEAS